MTTITQKKKGWWKIWVLLAFIAVLVVTAVILYALGYDYISWIGAYLVGAKLWSSATWINAVLDSFLWLGVGLLGAWAYYNYLRGNKVVVAQNTAPGYSPAPTYPASQPQQGGTETTIS